MLTMATFTTVGGLGIIPGVVGRFDASGGLTVPHIGWNALKVREGSEILDDIGNRHVYFVHSYRAIPVCLSSYYDFFMVYVANFKGLLRQIV